MGEIKFGFITSKAGGQHTNGPDYGIVTAEHELAGVKFQVQTAPRFGPHKARALCRSLVNLAVQEIIAND